MEVMEIDQMGLERAVLAAARLVSLQHEGDRPFDKGRCHEMAGLVGVVHTSARHLLRIPTAFELGEVHAQAAAVQAYAHDPMVRQAVMISVVCRLAFLSPQFIHRHAIGEGLLLVVQYTALSLGYRKSEPTSVLLQAAPLTLREKSLLRLLEIVGCHLVEELDDTPESVSAEVQRLEEFYHQQVALLPALSPERQRDFQLSRSQVIAETASINDWMAMALQMLGALLIRHQPDQPSHTPDALFELLLTRRRQIALP